MICDLCGENKDLTDLFHFTGRDESDCTTYLFDPDFDQAIYCDDCMDMVQMFYYFHLGLDNPAIAVIHSEEPVFRDL